MRKASLLAAVATLMFGMVAPGVAVARPRTYVTAPDCQHLRIRPHSILFTCADHTYFVRRLEWSHWGPWKAIGTGVFHRNDCNPSCAEGTFHHRRGTLRLSDRGSCPDMGKHVFKWSRAHYNRPLLGEDGEAGALPLCPTAS